MRGGGGWGDRRQLEFPVTDDALDAPDGAVVDGYQRRGDRWSAVAPGTCVRIDVKWFNGRTSRMSGTLICIDGGEAYVETELGNVVGPAGSLEVIEDI